MSGIRRRNRIGEIFPSRESSGKKKEENESAPRVRGRFFPRFAAESIHRREPE